MDVQGFKTSGNHFVFKEFAAQNPRGESSITYYFKPPFPWTNLEPRYKCENTWLSRNYLGLSWESGDVPYNTAILETLLLSTNIVYVKGLEKTYWLEREFPGVNCVNMEDFGCPQLNKLKKEQDVPVCVNHLSPYLSPNCAVQNVKLLKDWFSHHIM